MSAALRNATARLSGRALQRSQAAIQGGQRRLIGNKGLSMDEQKNAIFRLAQIQSTKAVLYNKIKDFERNYIVSGKLPRQNSELLELLSSHIGDKPSCSPWRTFVSFGITYGGALCLGHVLGNTTVDWIKEKYPDTLDTSKTKVFDGLR